MIATASDRRAEIGRARDGNARLEELARSGTRDACPYRPPYRQKLRLGCVPRQSRLPGTGAGADALYRRRRLAEGGRSEHAPARRFHLSLIHQPVEKYAPCHYHEVVEHFLVLDGVLTVGWMFGGDGGADIIEAKLGPLDMVLNQSERPHGFRNDGVEPVLMSISVGSGSPKPPVYACHPKDHDPALARRFGALPGRTSAFDPDSDDPRQREMARYIVRHAERRPVWQAGLARLDYVGDGGAPPGGYRMEMIHLPRGVAVRGYRRAVEDAYFVLDGAVTVGWEEDGETAEQRLGRLDVIQNPPGRTRWFRNDGVTDATFMLLSGGARG